MRIFVIPMGNKVSPHMIMHLAYCKSLYAHGVEHSNSDSVRDRAIAVLSFDNAVEMLLYCVLDSLGGQAPREIRTYHDLIDHFKKKVAESKGGSDLVSLHEVEINNMHIARNGIQHHGIIPSIDDVERYGFLTHEVLSEVTAGVLELSFEEVYLGELIKNDLVRRFYESAESAFASGDYEDALVYVAGAFELAKNKEQPRLWGSGRDFALLGSGVDNLTSSLIWEMGILKLRLDYKKYQKYREVFLMTLQPSTKLSSHEFNLIFNEIKELAKNAISVWGSWEKSVLREYATFCLNFVIDSILRWESVVRRGWLE